MSTYNAKDVEITFNGIKLEPVEATFIKWERSPSKEAITSLEFQGSLADYTNYEDDFVRWTAQIIKDHENEL